MRDRAGEALERCSTSMWVLVQAMDAASDEMQKSEHSEAGTTRILAKVTSIGLAVADVIHNLEEYRSLQWPKDN